MTESAAAFACYDADFCDYLFELPLGGRAQESRTGNEDEKLAERLPLFDERFESIIFSPVWQSSPLATNYLDEESYSVPFSRSSIFGGTLYSTVDSLEIILELEAFLKFCAVEEQANWI